MSFGNVLKKLRISKNLSQKELAGILDVGRSALDNYEQDKRTPDFETLKKISRYFDISVDYLLENNHIKNNQNILQSMNNLLIVHDSKSKTTMLFVDGKIIDAPIYGIEFKHIIKGKNAEINLSFEPGTFSLKDTNIVEILKKMGYPIG